MLAGCGHDGKFPQDLMRVNDGCSHQNQEECNRNSSPAAVAATTSRMCKLDSHSLAGDCIFCYTLLLGLAAY